jgi:hypothetical protein
MDSETNTYFTLMECSLTIDIVISENLLKVVQTFERIPG